MSGTSHSTNQYTYESLNGGSHISIGINNGEPSLTHKMNIILDDVSLERVNSLNFLVS